MRRLALCALAACASAKIRSPVLSGALGYDVAISEDGRRAAAVVLDTEFRLIWLALPEGKPTGTVTLGDPTYDCADVAVSGETAAVACRDGRVHVYAGTRRIHELRLDGAATAVALTPDWLITGSSTGVLCLRRLGDAALLQCVAEHLGEVSALVVDGDHLMSGAHDGTVTEWELPSLRVVQRWQIAGVVTALSGHTAAVAEQRPRLPERGAGFLVSLDDPTRKTPVDGYPVALAPTRAGLAAATWAPALLVGGRPLAHGFPHVLRGLAATPDGRTLWVAGFSQKTSGPAVTRVDVPAPR